jgi:splicing factor 3B subunit 3
VRTLTDSLCARMRPYGHTLQDCTDGDLCEQFSTLPVKLQKSIAAELDRSPAEVVKKLEDFRNCIL